MKRGYFITGTDTGVGKTLIASALVHHFAQNGQRAVGLKPVATGCAWHDGQLLSDDVAELQAASNVTLPLQIINPYAFEPPLAPHIAAALVGQRIEIKTLLNAYEQAATATDVVVVEGVGGFRVPLNNHEDTADLAARLALPVILVIGVRLGCLSHALLTAESIASRGLKLASWVANVIDPQMAALQEYVQSLKQRIAAPCLGVVPWNERADFVQIEALLRQQGAGILQSNDKIL
ncbi:MAG: dethiobiotin synthase [Methylobacillus sp.]|jgi:dethiobiotin synthetase|nr:dethiobiotin synthase [Methylobacillus sp.]